MLDDCQSPYLNYDSQLRFYIQLAITFDRLEISTSKLNCLAQNTITNYNV